MTRRLLLSASLACLPASGLFAQSPERLVERLGSADYREREAAERALGTMGPGAADAVRGGLRSPSPEVRRRSANLLPGLERAALAPAVARAPEVGFDHDGVTVGECLLDWERRTGVPCHLLAGEDVGRRCVTLKSPPRPAWAAFDALLSACDLQEVAPSGWMGPGAAGRVVLAPGRRAQSASLAGPIRVRQVEGGAGWTDGSAELTLELECQPLPVPVCRDILGIRDVRATDERGRVLRGSRVWFPARPPECQPPEPDAVGGAAVAFRPLFAQSAAPSTPAARRVALTLATPGDPPARLERVTATLVVRLLTWPLVLGEVPVPPRPDAPVEIRCDDRVLTVLGVRESGGQTHVHARLVSPPEEPRPTPPPAPLLRLRGNGAVLIPAPEVAYAHDTPRLELLDRAGSPLACAGESVSVSYSSAGVQTQDWNLSYDTPPGSAPARLRLVGRRPVVADLPIELVRPALP